ncbi:MAG: hypothetical protein LBF28_02095 [Rickettsiales bacterium]|nr:hypothetical protein [Rickettsiales bacterium]
MNQQKNFKRVNNRPKQSAALQIFNKQYLPYVSSIVVEEFGRSYDIVDNIKNTWRAKFDISQEIADFLILKTKTFIRLMNSADSNSTNPQFLKSLIASISDYLSAYFMRFDNVGKRKNVSAALERFHQINGTITARSSKANRNGR